MRRSLPILLLLAACFPAFVAIVPKPLLLKNYEIGQPQSATVGEPIFRVQQAAEVPMWVAEFDHKPRGMPQIRQGMRFFAIGTVPNEPTTQLISNPTYSTAQWIVIDSRGVPIAWQSTTSRNKTTFGNMERPLFRRITEIGEQPGAFTAEMIYSGLAGNVVRAVYREYVSSLARPAFSQELQYDLSADSVIAYKSIRLRVTRATNTQIQFVVTDDGGLPWLPAPRAEAELFPVNPQPR